MRKGTRNLTVADLVPIIVIFLALALVTTVFRPTAYIIGFPSMSGDEWEGMTELVVDTSQKIIVTHIVFDQYKTENCADNIHVESGNQTIPFSTDNVIMIDNLCTETDVIFDNIGYQELAPDQPIMNFIYVVFFGKIGPIPKNVTEQEIIQPELTQEVPQSPEQPVQPEAPEQPTPEFPPPEPTLLLPERTIIGPMSMTGNFLQLNNSAYVNVSVMSSEVITLTLDAPPEMVDMQINSSAASSRLTVIGLFPNTAYHMYVDSYRNHNQFTTDSAGSYSFDQDLSEPHHIWIQPRPSTKFINNTGGDCSSIGTWDDGTSTCTLTTDPTETIEIDNSDITLDCAGHTILGTGTGNGIYVLNTNPNIVNTSIKNCMMTNFSYGVHLEDSHNNSLTNNTLYNNTYGIYIYGNNNTVTNNTAYNNTQYGIYLGGYNNTVTNNTAYNNSEGINLEYGNSTISNNTLYSNNYGIRISGGGTYNNIFDSNNIYNNKYGIDLSNSNNNNITNNTVYNSTSYGIHLSIGNNNTLINNTVDGTTNSFGIYLESSSNALVINNTVYNQFSGFVITGGNNTVTNNTAYNNSGYGISVSSGWYNTLTNNTVYNNSYGIYVGYYSQKNTLINNTIYNTVNGPGILLSAGSNNTITNNTILNNKYGITLESTYGQGSSNNTIIFNKITNSTTWVIQIISGSGNNLTYNYWGVPYVCNATRKNVSSSWLLPYYTDDPMTTLDYGPVFCCNDLIVADLTFPTDLSCTGDGLIVEENNITIDCAGYSLTGTGSNGIYIYRNNATITNCNISKFGYGIYSYYSNYSTITNNTVYNNSKNIFVYQSNNNSLTNNTVYNATNGHGIELDYSYNNTLTNNTAYKNKYSGMHIYQGGFNTLTNNTARSNNHGISLDSSNNTLANNTAYNNSDSGIRLSSTYSDNNTLINNLIYNNTIYGLYFDFNSGNNTITNNTVYKSTYGIYLKDSPDNTFNFNRIYNNTQYDAYQSGSSGSNFTYNYWNNSYCDIKLYNVTRTDLLPFYTDFDLTSLQETGGLCCGDTVTSNVMLSSNLTCTGSGLTVGANNINIDCAGNTLSGSGTGNGIYASGRNNVTIANCSVRNFWYGIYLESSNNNTITNSTVYSNIRGIWLVLSTNNILINNTAYNQTVNNGIELSSSSNNNTLANNIAYNNSGGISLSSSNSNTLIGNTLYNNSQNGIYSYSSTNNTVTNNTAYNNTQYGIYLGYSSNNNTITNNTFFKNTQMGVYIDSSRYNDIHNNTMNNGTNGMAIEQSHYNTIYNNTMNNNYRGIYLYYSNNNTITNNTFYNSTGIGIYTWSDGNNNTIIFNRITNSTTWDLNHVSGTGNNFTYNYWGVSNICNAKITGIAKSQMTPYYTDEPMTTLDYGPITICPGETITSNTNLTSNLTCTGNGLIIGASNILIDCQGNYIIGSGSGTGLDLTSFNNVTIKNCGITGFSNGIYITAGNNSFINNTKIYNNTAWDYYSKNCANNTGLNITLSTANISFLGQDFAIGPVTTPPSAPGNISIYFNATNTTGPTGTRPPYDPPRAWAMINVSYNEPLPYGVDENTLLLYRYNSSNMWQQVTPTGVNSASNYVWANITNFSKFAPLGTPGIACGDNINSSTILSNNLGPCPGNGLNINATNIVLDCDGHSITGSNTNYGISVNSKQNVTFKNCIINSFQQGIYLYYSSNNTLTNNTLYNNTDTGVYLEFSNNNSIKNNSIYNSTTNGRGIYLKTSNNNTITNNIIHDNTNTGIQLGYYSNYNNLTNNTIYNNPNSGIYLSVSSYNKINNNTVYNTTGFGIYLVTDARYNEIYNNTVYNSNSRGILISTSNNILTNNTLYNNTQYGIQIDTSTNNTLTGNTLYNNTGVGVYVYQSNMSILTNNTIYNTFSNGRGVYIHSSNLNTLNNNTLYNNTNGIYLFNSNNNTLYNNTAYNNTRGICINRSSFNILNNTKAYDNIQEGILDEAAPPTSGPTCGNEIWEQSLGEVCDWSAAPSGCPIDYYCQSNCLSCYLVGPSYNTIANSDVQRNYIGIKLLYEDNCNVTNNSVAFNTYGIYLNTTSQNNRLANNAVYNNTDTGIYVFNSTNNTMTKNRACDNINNDIELASSSNNTGDNICNNKTDDDANSVACPYDCSLISISSCQNISSSGTYILLDNITGNQSTGRCIDIQAPNVVLECDDYYLNGPGISVSESYGIYTNSSNTTIQNCNIQEYSRGIIISPNYDQANNTFIVNNTLNNNNVGIFGDYYTHSITVTNNNISGSLNGGIYLRGTTDNTTINNTITNNTFWNNGNGINTNSMNYSLISYNNFINTSGNGMSLYYSSKNIVRDNSLIKSYYGVYVAWDSNNNTITNNTAANSISGIHFYESKNNTIENNTAYNNSDIGISLESNSNNNILNFNRLYNNTGYDASQSDSSGNNFTYNYWGAPYCDINVYNITRTTLLPFYTDIDLTTLQETGSFCGCGDTMMSDTTLTQNLTCTGAGITIGANDVTLDCAGHSLTGDTTGFGISLSSRSNVTIKNCNVTNFNYGASLVTSTNNTFADNMINGNSHSGFRIISNSDNNTLINNIVSYNTYNGIGVDQSSNNTYINNTLNSNTNGISIGASSDNTIINNTANNNAVGIDIESNSNNNIITNNTANNNTAEGINLLRSINNSITGNIANSNGYGIELSSDSNNNTVANNTAYNNRNSGILIFASSENNTVFANEVIYNQDGIELLSSSDNNFIQNNTASNNTRYGILLDYSYNNTLIDNTANYNINDIGIKINSGQNNTLINNTANYDQFGIFVQSSTNNILTNNTAKNSSITGIELFYSSNNTVYNNTANNNFYYGLYLAYSPDNILINNTIYSNKRNGVWFDLGSNNNDLNFNKIYNNTQRDAYQTSSSGNNFTYNYWGAPYCDIKLYNITRTDLLPFYTDFDLTTLQETAGFCGCGDTMMSDVTLTQNLTCPEAGITIGASDVTLDCDGHTISGSNTGNGIYLYSKTNVTIKNCNVTHFRYGIFVSTSNNNTLANNTANYNTEYGIFFRDSSEYNTLINNTANNNKHGIYFYYTAYNANALINNTANNNTQIGINFEASSNNSLTGNTANNNQHGIYIYGSVNSLTGNTANNNQHGIFLDTSHYNNLTANTANNNNDDGIYLYTSINNTLINNTVNNNKNYGVYIYFSSNSAMNFNRIYNNTQYDAYQSGGSGNNFTYNYWGAPYCDIKLYDITRTDLLPFYTDIDLTTLQETGSFCGCGETMMSDVTLTRNLNCTGAGITIGADDITLDCAGHTITGTGNNGDGISSYGSTNITIKNCTVVNWYNGIAVGSVSQSNIFNNTAEYNNYGIEVYQASHDNIIENNTLNQNSNTGVSLENGPLLNKISNNVFTYGSTGLRLSSGNNSTVYNNTFYAISTTAVYIFNTAMYNNVTYNNISYNGGGLIIGSSNNTINYNWVFENSNFNVDLLSSTGNNFTYNYWGSTNLCDAKLNGVNRSDAIPYFEDSGMTTLGYTNPSVCCGDTVTTSTTLSYDLNCSTNEGLRIGANNVVFDCAGHYIRDSPGSNNYGIYVNGRTNTTINNCNITRFYYGIYIDSSWNSSIENSTTSYNRQNGIYLASASGTNITNSTANNQNVGMTIASSHNCTIINNTVKNNQNTGIQYAGSRYGVVENNTISLNNGASGIRIESSATNNTFTSNILNNNNYGILIYDSYNNFTNNTACANSNYDIFLSSSSSNNIGDNTCTNKRDDDSNPLTCLVSCPWSFTQGVCGQEIQGDVTLTQDLSCSGTYGMRIAADNVVIDCNGYTIRGQREQGLYGIVSPNSPGYDNITIKNCNITNLGGGISFANSNNGTIENNTIYNNIENGITLWGSSYKNINNNTIRTNSYGIYSTQYSTYNNFSNNTVCSNTNQDIYLDSGSTNNYGDNTCTKKQDDDSNPLTCTQCPLQTVNISSCQSLYGDTNYLLTQNISANYNDCFYINGNGATLDCAGHSITGTGSYNAVYSSYHDNVTIKNCTINNFDNGIYFSYSHNGTITDNTANNNQRGLYIQYSNNNQLTNNTVIENNQYGIYLQSSSYANIINNLACMNSNRDIYIDYGSSSSTGSNICSNLDPDGSSVTCGPGCPTTYPPKEITNCQALVTPGRTYLLTQDVNDYYSYYYCFDAQADNVTLDCQGHTVTGPNPDSYWGYGFNANWRNNVTVKNCKFAYFSEGIYLYGTPYANVINNTVANNSDGIYLGYNNHHSNIINNTALDNSNQGIYLGSNGGNSNVSDNLACYSQTNINIQTNPVTGDNTCDVGSSNFDGSTVTCSQDCPPPSPKEINNCMALSVRGRTYLLTSDITSSYCFYVYANDVVLDCQGHRITGYGIGSGPAVQGSSRNNFTIKNCNITNFDYGINFNSFTNSQIGPNTICANNRDIYIDSSSNTGDNICDMTSSYVDGSTVTCSANCNEYTIPQVSFVTPTPNNGANVGVVTIGVRTRDIDMQTGTNTCWVNFDGSIQPMTKLGSGKDIFCTITEENLALGQHTFQAFANDSAGNMGQTEQRTINVNTTATPITNCQSLNNGGVYELQNDIPNAQGWPCFYIGASYVVLDCKGHTLTGPGSSYRGIEIGSDYAGVQIRNCNITGFQQGILINNNANNNDLTNNTVCSSSDTDIYFSGGTTNNNTGTNNICRLKQDNSGGQNPGFEACLPGCPLPPPTPITSCQSLNTRGAIYSVTQDVLDNYNSWNCFDIGSDYITLDCNGHNITGPNPSSPWGRGVYGNWRTGTTIQNCTFADFQQGIEIDYMSGTQIINNSFYNNQNGLVSYSSWNSNISNNIVNSSRDTGISLYGFYNSGTSALTNNIMCSNTNNDIYFGSDTRNNTGTNNICQYKEDSGQNPGFEACLPGCPVAPPVEVNFCQQISTKGTYLLTQDIQKNTSVWECFGIHARGVTLDCQGHTVTGPYPSGQSGAGVYADSNANGLTVKNCTFTHFDQGMYLSSLQHANLTNNTFQYNYNGLQLQSSSQNTITYSTFQNNTYGIQLQGASQNTINYNIIFGNSDKDVYNNQGAGNNFTYNYWGGNACSANVQGLSRNDLAPYYTDQEMTTLDPGPLDCPIGCGDFITKSVILPSDLSCSGPTYGLTIGADNIVLDCAGHSITGPYAYEAVYASGRTNVTVKNCTIRQWSIGISFNSVTSGTILNNTITNTQNWGIILGGSSNTKVLNNSVSNGYQGLGLQSSSQDTINYNKIFSNTQYDLYVSSSNNEHLDHNYWGGYICNAKIFAFDKNGLTPYYTDEALTTLDPGPVDCPLACGDFITKSVTMTSDLSCPSMDAITLNANNIVFDCDGHNITGPGSSGTGIFAQSLSNLTVKNCTITGFDTGIYWPNIQNSYIINNTVMNHQSLGLRLSSSSTGNKIFDNRFSGFYYSGMDLRDSSSNNNFTNNYAYSERGVGILVQSSSSNNFFFNNTGESSNVGGCNHQECGGIFLGGYTNNNQLINNTGKSINGYGIRMARDSSNILINNTAYSENRYGIYLRTSANSNTLSSNFACWNGQNDIYLDGSTSGNSGDNTCDNLLNSGSNTVTCGTTCPPAPPNTFASCRSFTSANKVYILTQNITRDYNDQVCLRLQASNITIDCQGHTITGPNPNGQWGIGIYIDSSGSGSTIKNCTFTHFDYGTQFSSSSGVELTNNTASNNNNGFYISSSPSTTVTDNYVMNNSANGIFIYYSDNSVVTNNIGSNNNLGIQLDWSNNVNVNNNTMCSNNQRDIEMSYYTSNIYGDNICTNRQDYDSNPLTCTPCPFYQGVCSQAIAQNTTLTDDLLNCPNTGITIGADNITLDCDGHSIIGLGSYNGINIQNHNNVTVKNCNVTYFNYGIYLDSSYNNTLTNNTAINNTDSGIYLGASYNNTLTNNTISNDLAGSGNNYGIYLGASYNNILTNNTVSIYNWHYWNIYGIYLTSSNNNILTVNNVSNNYGDMNGYGIYLDSSNNNILTGNDATHNGGSFYSGYGIYLTSSSSNNISDNTANKSYGYSGGYGIYLQNSQINNLNNNYFCNNTANDTYLDAATSGNIGNNYCDNKQDDDYNIGLTCSACMPPSVIPLNVSVFVNTVQTNNLTNKGEPQNLTIIVKNNETGDPIQGATVNVFERNGLLLFSLPQYSDSNVTGTGTGILTTDADGVATLSVIPTGSVGHSAEIGPYELIISVVNGTTSANVTLDLTNDTFVNPSYHISIPNAGNIGGNLNAILSVWSYAVEWYNRGGGDAISMTVFENGTAVGDSFTLTKAKPAGFTISVRNDTDSIEGATVIINETNGYQLFSLPQYGNTNVSNIGGGQATTGANGIAKLTVIPTGGPSGQESQIGPYSLDMYVYAQNGTLIYNKIVTVNQNWITPSGTPPSLPNSGNIGGYLNSILSVWSYAVGWFNY